MKKVRFEIYVSVFLLGFCCASRSNQLMVGTSATQTAETFETITTQNVSRIKEVGKLFFPTPANGLNWVSAFAFSPNGKMFACGDLLGLVTLFDTETKSEISVFRGHSSMILSVTFNPTGTLLASSSGDPDNLNPDTSVRLWDVASKTQVAQIDKAYKQLGLRLSPDGRTLALDGFDGVVRLWDVDKQALKTEFKGHKNWVGRVQFGAYSDILASSSGDGTIKLWNIKSGALTQTLSVPDGTWGMAFKPNSSVLAAGENDTVSIWDSSNGTELIRLAGYEGAVASVNFSPYGTLLVSDSGFENPNHALFIWDLAQTTKTILSGHTDIIETVLFSPDGKFIVSASRDDTLRFWGVTRES